MATMARDNSNRRSADLDGSSVAVDASFKNRFSLPIVSESDFVSSELSGGNGRSASKASSTDSPSVTPVTPTEFLQSSSSLSADEEQATNAFLSVVNPWRLGRGCEPMSWASAVKFLMARKFHVERSLVLYQQHELMRIREGLDSFDAREDPLRRELDMEKFTILPSYDPNGASLAVFNAWRHDPAVSSHRSTLQCVVYQLDVALEDVRTQRGGLVFIYNMSQSKYANFDYDLSQKMLTLLKGAYPARLKKVLIVTAPLWFKAPFKVLRLFVREKLRDRVFTVSLPQLQQHVPLSSLPSDLGGSMPTNHVAWLQHCADVTKSRDGELVTMTSSQPTTPTSASASSLPTLTASQQSASTENVCRPEEASLPAAAPFTSTGASYRRKKHPTLEQLKTLPVTVSGAASPGPDASSVRSPGLAHSAHRVEPPPEDEDSLRVANGSDDGRPKRDDHDHEEDERVSSEGSGLSDDEAELNIPTDASGLTLSEFIEHVRVKGRRGLYEEYGEIKNRPPTGTFNHARAFENQVKNRYTDVLCYDHSRVLLANSLDGSDYINANFVDGYKQPRAFISSQGPLPRTFPDFWQMVWEQQTLVIVMTTKTIERHRTKCGQYWPEDCGASLSAGPFEIHSDEMENVEDFIVTHLTLTRHADDGSEEKRRICHFQFVSWPDYGVPDSAVSMLHFLQRVREKQAEMLGALEAGEWAGHPLGPPIVVHCSAGIGRTGTFATLDIAIRKFEDIQRVDIRTTVEKIRSQRAFSIQMPDQYVFCHLAFLEYALNMEYVEEVDLTGFDEDCDSE